MRHVRSFEKHREACQRRKLSQLPQHVKAAGRAYDGGMRFVEGASGQPSVDKKLLLFVALPSGPSHVLQRQAVRTGWAASGAQGGRAQAREWNYRFFVGAAGLNQRATADLRQEANTFGDMVLVDMVDNYQNLTLLVVNILMHVCQELRALKSSDRLGSILQLSMQVCPSLLKR